MAYAKMICLVLEDIKYAAMHRILNSVT